MSESSLLDGNAEAEAPAVEQPPASEEAPALERPEWLQDKYITEERSLDDAISEQAKAYVESQKMLGAFTGAPEDGYEFKVPEGIEGEVDTELEAYQQFTALAKDKNINQETAQELFNIFANYQQQQAGQMEVDRNAQIEELGANAQQRLQALNGWSNANLTPEQNETMLTMTTTADQIETLEAIIQQTKDTPIPKTHGDTETITTGYSLEQFAIDSATDKYHDDPVYRKMILQKVSGIV